MAAPTNTYNSSVNLNLGQLTDLESVDVEVYNALTDIHNALEILATGVQDVEDGAGPVNSFVAKYRNNTDANAGNTPYTIQLTDGTILVDASVVSIVVNLHSVTAGDGYRYEVKRVDTNTTNTATLQSIDGDIDGHSAITLTPKDCYVVKNTGTNWVIL